MLRPGDPVPAFFARSSTNPRYAFATVAGRNAAVAFIGSSTLPGAAQLLAECAAARDLFDDSFACLFVVSADPADEAGARLAERIPGIRVLWDHDGELARLFGCRVEAPDGRAMLRPATFVLDPGLRVAAVLPITDPATHFAPLSAALRALPHPEADCASIAPVLTVPQVLEPELCRRFIAYAEAQQMEESGFMRTDPATGETVLKLDHGHKRRSDCQIADEQLRGVLQGRVLARIVPAIERAFQFRVTRMERYMIGRYDAETGGHFRPHKDNTTAGTAHRRFAVSIGLDADSYEGGDLRFPEFGRRTYRPPSGGAIVFSCSLLHEVLPVTRGTRYVILPFLYDEEAARQRIANAAQIQDPALRDNVLANVGAVRA